MTNYVFAREGKRVYMFERDRWIAYLQTVKASIAEDRMTPNVHNFASAIKVDYKLEDLRDGNSVETALYKSKSSL